MHISSYTVAFATLIGAVAAHGRLGNPAGLPHTGSQAFLKDIRVPANGCGEGVTISGKAVATFKAGSTQEVTWIVDNGDGAGPLAVAFDPSGKGTGFSAKAKIVKQLDGQNGGVPNSFPRGNHQISFTVPNIKCTGCVMQVRQDLNSKDGFGSCAVVDIN
jgi:hypothetical protein